MSTLKSPTANPAITPDPHHDGSIIRKAFLAEALANLCTIPLITNTRLVLSLILLHPSRDITPSSILFARLFGVIVVGGLTSTLLAGYRNTRNGIESRRIVYLLLGAGEVLMIPVLILEALKDGGRDAAISQLMASTVVGLLAPPLMWRVYVLFWRPELLGMYRERERGDKKVE